VFIVVEEKTKTPTVGILENALNRIRSVADYQFGKGVGKILFSKDVEIVYSKTTGRIRYLNLNGERLATLRPTDGLLSLSIKGARTVAKNAEGAHCFVTVREDVAGFVAEGGDVFSAHVVAVDEDVRSKDEVIVVDGQKQVLAVGRALLSSYEMRVFKTGVAVKVRHGNTEES
jgi:uncharacterized protein with predicted RNA binding PUA domain